MIVYQSDQVRTRYVQEVGGFLCGEFCVHGKNGDGVAVSKLADDLQEELLDGARKFDSGAVL